MDTFTTLQAAIDDVRAKSGERGLEPSEVDVAICRGGRGCLTGGSAICEACFHISLDDPRTAGEIHDAMRRGDA